MSADLLPLDSADLVGVRYAAACGVVSGRNGRWPQPSGW